MPTSTVTKPLSTERQAALSTWSIREIQNHLRGVLHSRSQQERLLNDLEKSEAQAIADNLQKVCQDLLLNYCVELIVGTVA
jgi:hypothetical protein